MELIGWLLMTSKAKQHVQQAKIRHLRPFLYFYFHFLVVIFPVSRKCLREMDLFIYLHKVGTS